MNFSNQFGYRLVPVYIPNQGYQYLIAVPVDKWNHLNTNHISDHQQQKFDKYEKYDKYNGRYNAKLKKYKAYEKFLKPQQQKQQVKPRRVEDIRNIHVNFIDERDVMKLASKVWHRVYIDRKCIHKILNDSSNAKKNAFDTQRRENKCFTRKLEGALIDEWAAM